MLKKLIRNMIKTELDATLLLKINEIEYLMREYDRQFIKLSKEMNDIKESCEKERKYCDEKADQLCELKDELNEYVNDLIHDTNIKLESYSEAALALLKTK